MTPETTNHSTLATYSANRDRTWQAGAIQRELYRSLPLIRYPTGDGTELIYFPSDQTYISLPTRLAEILYSCAQFRTLTEHADTISGSQVTAVSVTKTLAEFAEAGALVSLQGMLRTRAQTEPEVSREIAMITIPTRDRPFELDMAVRSYSANALSFGRRPQFLITDDLPERHPFSAWGAAGVLRKATHAEVYYAGRSEKRRFASLVAKEADVAPDIVEFGICGNGCDDIPQIGANRNSILLQTQGRAVLSVDDDTVCRTGRSPDASNIERLKVGVEGDPTDFWFFKSQEAVMEFTRWDKIDVIGEHERLLGRSLCNLISQWDESLLDVDLMCGHIWKKISAGNGRVRVTYNGVAGDSALYSGWLPNASVSAATWARLTDSETAFHAARESRQILRHSPSVAVGHFNACLATCIGLDNTELLPPFFPIGRNEDGIFGMTMEHCVPSACAAHLPWSMMHSPPGKRSYDPDATRKTRISDAVVCCVSTWRGSPSAQTTEGALRSLGRHLIELAELGTDGLDEVIRHGLWQMASVRAQQCEVLLKKYGHWPKYWADGVRKQNELLRKAMLDPAFLIPSDLPYTAEDARSRVQDLILRFGRLLDVWPAITKASARLRGRGIEMAIKV